MHVNRLKEYRQTYSAALRLRSRDLKTSSGLCSGKTGRRAAFFTVLLAISAPAAAQDPNICQDLRSQLSSLPEVIGNGPEVRRYASAIAEQNIALRRLRNDMRQNDCSSGSVVVIGRGNDDYCAGLEQAEARMVDNIHYLEERRSEMRSQGGSDYQTRRKLHAALEENGCETAAEEENTGTESVYTPAPAPEQQAMRSDSFIAPNGTMETPPSRLPAPGLVAHINTMCVRTCDGGFFPVSSNTTSIDFARDADTCAKMCPGIPTELFYQDVGNGDASAMVSTKTGAPYSQLPNAFSYKNRKPGEKSACACDLSGYYDKLRKNQTLADEPTRSSVTTIETAPKKAVVTAPATPTAPMPALQPSVPDRPYDPAQNNVRQVGPQFFAGEQGTLDLKNPAKPSPQPRQ